MTCSATSGFDMSHLRAQRRHSNSLRSTTTSLQSLSGDQLCCNRDDFTPTESVQHQETITAQLGHIRCRVLKIVYYIMLGMEFQIQLIICVGSYCPPPSGHMHPHVHQRATSLMANQSAGLYLPTMVTLRFADFMFPYSLVLTWK